MSAERDADAGIVLTGLDGSNPLAFLAALGTLRALDLATAGAGARMGWRVHGAAWRPEITVDGSLTEGTLLDLLENQLRKLKGHPALARWDNLGVPPEEYRIYALDARAAAGGRDRIWADFAAAFACEVVTTTDSKKQPVVRDTAFRTMSGAGYQHFLGNMRNIVATTTREHLAKALFAVWTYDDPLVNSTLRWDPADDIRHALQWRDPSGDPARRTGGTVLGANRLAIEALPLFSTAPVGSKLETTGFSGSGARDTFWSWPIWSGPASIDVCRTMLALEELVAEAPDRATLRARGVAVVYRSQRITEGKYRNFTPARAMM